MNLTKEQQATHAYEILNMIAGDIFSATFFNQLTARWENDPRVNAEAKKIIVHLNRNRLRIAASALHRYIEVFESRIKFLEFDKTEAQTLNQKLNGHEISGLRHLFEHSLSKYTQEPHSPDIVTKYLEMTLHTQKAKSSLLLKSGCRGFELHNTISTSNLSKSNI